MVEKILVSARSYHFGAVYTLQVWKSRSVQLLRYSGVRHRQTFLQTIYSNPPEEGGSITVVIILHLLITKTVIN